MNVKVEYTKTAFIGGTEIFSLIGASFTKEATFDKTERADTVGNGVRFKETVVAVVDGDDWHLPVPVFSALPKDISAYLTDNKILCPGETRTMQITTIREKGNATVARPAMSDENDFISRKPGDYIRIGKIRRI